MFDHIGFPVSNLPHSKRFYQTALEPLGVAIIMELTAEQTGSSSQAGFGENGKPYFWIGEGTVGSGMHLAFVAQTRKQVDEFYRAAIAAGGKDNGPPGIRAHYHPNYYGAFVIDPNGVNLEAVCHTG